MFIDTHSHLYEEEFREDREESILRAREAGVEYFILPDIDRESRERMLAIEEQYPGIMFPLIGLHPTSVHDDYREELAQVEKYLGTHRFYGIGECGIDLYWDKSTFKEQVKAFEHQLELAKDMNFPVVIHSRNSLDEIFKILKKHPYTRGILHCFPGNVEEAQLACEMGFLLGIGGVVTFKNSEMAKVVQQINPTHLVLETDAPYLTPAPHRGKRNESGYIPLIAAKVAELTGEDIKEIERITTQNAVNLFNLQSQSNEIKRVEAK